MDRKQFMFKVAELFLILLFLGCKSSIKEIESIELINNNSKQDTIFKSLQQITYKSVSDDLWDDSLAFLILPVQASCPSCRKKTIDSIVKYDNVLLKNHYIIISANGGRKTINGYFQEVDRQLPDNKKVMILDTSNVAHKLGLYDKKPTIYYTFRRKAYKKVAAIPATVKDDLREFFSGFRTLKKMPGI